MRRLSEPSHLDLCCLQKPIIIACGSERVKARNTVTDESKLLSAAVLCLVLTFTTLWANLEDKLMAFFPRKQDDISYELIPLETICMKCQNLFSGEKKKFLNENVVCWNGYAEW